MPIEPVCAHSAGRAACAMLLHLLVAPPSQFSRRFNRFGDAVPAERHKTRRRLPHRWDGGSWTTSDLTLSTPAGPDSLPESAHAAGLPQHRRGRSVDASPAALAGGETAILLTRSIHPY